MELVISCSLAVIISYSFTASETRDDITRHIYP